MFRKCLVATAIVLLGAIFGSLAPPARAEVELKAISAWPRNFPTVSLGFLRFVKIANEAGKGEYHIKYIGGPEIAKAAAQPEGFKAGIYDMMFTASSYHRGIIPEVDALSGNRIAPWVARANGGLAVLNEAVSEKINGQIISWIAGVSFVLYLRKAPERTAAGGVDLTGFKIRSVPVYDAFLNGLGATTVTIRVPEIYTALERGMVDGFAFPELWTRKFGWAKFVKYRIYPNFMQMDVGIFLNNDSYAKISKRGRDTLMRVAAQFEMDDYFFWKPLIEKEREILAKEFGQKEIRLEGKAAAAYRTLANQLVRDRLAKVGTPRAKKLGQIYHDRK